MGMPFRPPVSKSCRSVTVQYIKSNYLVIYSILNLLYIKYCALLFSICQPVKAVRLSGSASLQIFLSLLLKVVLKVSGSVVGVLKMHNEIWAL